MLQVEKIRFNSEGSSSLRMNGSAEKETVVSRVEKRYWERT